MDECIHYLECDCGRQADVVRSGVKIVYWCCVCGVVIAEEDDPKFA